MSPVGATLRDVTAAAARRSRGPSRQALAKRVARASGAPRWQARLRLYRERCPKPRCPSRYAVARVTRDYTSREAIETFAALECALCGHVIRAIRPPKVARGNDQRVRLTLILPGDQRRWYARGRWHTQGDDAVVLTEATLSDVIDAGAAWRKRADQYGEAKARAKAKREAAEAAASARMQSLLATWAEREAEAARAEAEADHRAA